MAVIPWNKKVHTHLRTILHMHELDSSCVFFVLFCLFLASGIFHALTGNWIEIVDKKVV